MSIEMTYIHLQDLAEQIKASILTSKSVCDCLGGNTKKAYLKRGLSMDELSRLNYQTTIQDKGHRHYIYLEVSLDNQEVYAGQVYQGNPGACQVLSQLIKNNEYSGLAV